MDIVTREEQMRQGLLRPRTSTLVPARAAGNRELSDQDRSILSSSVHAAGEMISRRQMSHIVRSDDTAVTQAYASLIYSAAYGFAAALITGGMVLILWIKYGVAGEGSDYALLWLLLWGISILVALIINRLQGLKYSSAGIARHEIDSRERIAMYVVDKHVELIEKRWHVENR